MLTAIHSDADELPPAILSQYPSLVQVRVKPNVRQADRACSSLISCVGKLLKGKGSTGVCTVLHGGHMTQLARHLQMDFSDVTQADLEEKDLLLLARHI